MDFLAWSGDSRFSHGRAGKSLKVRMVFDMGESWMDGRILKLVFFFGGGEVVAVVTLPWSPHDLISPLQVAGRFSLQRLSDMMCKAPNRFADPARMK